MAIPGLKTPTITAFTGLNTTTNLSAQAAGTLIAAQNVMILADQNVRRAPGYVNALIDAAFPASSTFPLTSMWDFQRSVDQAQFLIVQRGVSLYAVPVVNGAFGVPFLLTTLQSSVALVYVPSAIICYASNGTDAIRLIDNQGTLTAFNWGLPQPIQAPFQTVAPASNSGLTYAWDFGDGTTATTESPTHTYTADGTYDVALTVTSGANTATAMTSAVIGGSNSPKAEIGGPYRGTTTGSVTFDASNSTPSITTTLAPLDSSLTYAWNFGDGNSGTGIQAVNLYASPGTYIVSLTVTNAVPASTTIQTTATISVPPSTSRSSTLPPSSSGTAATPRAVIAAPLATTQGNVVTLSGASSTDPNASVLTYAWDFGDTDIGDGVSITHTFTSPGIYTLTLKVTNVAGLYSLVTQLIRVSNNIPVANAGTVQYAATGTAVTFDGSGSSSYTGLYLTYGRNYVACYVSKYVDSLGIQRVHVGPPSPISQALYTGPLVNQEVDMGLFYGRVSLAETVKPLSKPDPQITNIWVFATVDAPQNTNATYFFEAELGPGTLSTPFSPTFVDTFLDTDFDETKLAPFDNFPAPPSTVLARFQSRIFAIKKTLMQFSGGSDITLGIPDESFPASAFFNVPTGARLPTCAAVLNEGNILAVSNGDTWFRYTGYDAATFTEADKVATPGQVGRWSGALTPYGYAYISPSKRLWLWNGEGQPIELSSNVADTLLGTLGMDDLDPAYLAFSRVHWYSYGVRHFLAVLARSTAADATTITETTGDAVPLDWMQIYGVPTNGITGANSLYPTDKFPTDYPTCTCDQIVNGVPFVAFGSQGKGVMQFPSTFTDDGEFYASTMSHAWISLLEGDAKFFWLDIMVDTSDWQAAMNLGGPEQFMQVSARVLETPEDTPNGLNATVLSIGRIPKPRDSQQSIFAIRAKLQVPDCSIGRYIRVNITLAKSAAQIPFDVTVQKVILAAVPVYQGAP